MLYLARMRTYIITHARDKFLQIYAKKVKYQRFLMVEWADDSGRGGVHCGRGIFFLRPWDHGDHGTKGRARTMVDSVFARSLRSLRSLGLCCHTLSHLSHTPTPPLLRDFVILWLLDWGYHNKIILSHQQRAPQIVSKGTLQPCSCEVI